jgi:hypothetical protein
MDEDNYREAIEASFKVFARRGIGNKYIIFVIMCSYFSGYCDEDNNCMLKLIKNGLYSHHKCFAHSTCSCWINI